MSPLPSVYDLNFFIYRNSKGRAITSSDDFVEVLLSVASVFLVVGTSLEDADAKAKAMADSVNDMINAF